MDLTMPALKNLFFPTLYKKTNGGALQFWEIRVERTVGGFGAITTRWGQIGGAVQETIDVVEKGKNIGKKNETSPLDQAISEAQSKWEKQLKNKGYVESAEAAEAGERHELVEGGIDPMLAHKFRDHAKKIRWPAYVQPKLDGIRCIAIVQDGHCTLWSRTRKPITGVPHIAREIERMFPKGTYVLDGECYNHDLKEDFEKITSFVRQETPQPGHEIVQYHVYDMVIEDATFDYRATQLLMMPLSEIVLNVPTTLLKTEDEMLEYFATCLEAGYEGCMVRNRDGMYENKRSYNLQKVKEMQDAEFEIVGVEEGRGKMAGKAIFVCRTKDGKTFNAKMKGKLSDLVKYVKNPDLANGKLLTVQYQNLTADGIPRFPVGKAIRDYE